MDKAKAANLLAMNIPQKNVARALGVAESTLSEALKNDQELQHLLGEQWATAQVKAATKITTIEDLESTLLEKSRGLVEEVESLGEATMALLRINELKSRLQGKAVPSEAKITLQLPPNFAGQISIKATASGDILTIGDREMATMSPTRVMDFLSSVDAEASSEQESGVS